jgi:hypothetical protein
LPGTGTLAPEEAPAAHTPEEAPPGPG